MKVRAVEKRLKHYIFGIRALCVEGLVENRGCRTWSKQADIAHCILRLPKDRLMTWMLNDETEYSRDGRWHVVLKFS